MTLSPAVNRDSQYAYFEGSVERFNLFRILRGIAGRETENGRCKRVARWFFRREQFGSPGSLRENHF
jgi:hypothetical protein